MTNLMLQSALGYHADGLCVIPVIEREKRPSLPTWEEYFTRSSTENEIRRWWSNGCNFNIGIVHGAVSDNFVTLDIDHDAGLLDDLWEKHGELFAGRVEQSGSGEGYHIPLRLDRLPDFGFDTRQQRPRGNKTWKTDWGAINLRCQFCQTVAPPSIHPTGNPYKIIKPGHIVRLPDLDNLIIWLDQIAPPKIPRSNIPQKPIAPAKSNNLLAEVKSQWNCLSVFNHFGLAGNIRQERNGEFRLLGNGGLLVTENLELFYNFSDDFGGDCIAAWGYCRMGSRYDNRNHFRMILLEMAEAAGIATDKRTGETVMGDFAPLTIPPGDTLIVVAGEDKAETLKVIGMSAVGLPGNVFKREWARLFDPSATVYIALNPGKEAQAQAIAREFKANGLTAFTCSMSVPPDELITRYGGTREDFEDMIRFGRKV